jgi:ketosteroid isomerase-like protein
MDTRHCDAALKELFDRHAIAEVTQRYCRGVDRCDVDLVNSTYHPDAIDERMGSRSTGSEIGANLVQSLRDRMERSTHHITTQMIAIHGDIAACESYFIGIHALKDGTKMQSVGRYVDRFERREGEWKIAHRQVLHEQMDVTPFQAATTGASAHTVRRDQADPSYRVFKEAAGPD